MGGGGWGVIVVIAEPNTWSCDDNCSIHEEFARKSYCRLAGSEHTFNETSGPGVWEQKGGRMSEKQKT